MQQQTEMKENSSYLFCQIQGRLWDQRLLSTEHLSGYPLGIVAWYPRVHSLIACDVFLKIQQKGSLEDKI